MFAGGWIGGHLVGYRAQQIIDAASFYSETES